MQSSPSILKQPSFLRYSNQWYQTTLYTLHFPKEVFLSEICVVKYFTSQFTKCEQLYIEPLVSLHPAYVNHTDV